MVQMHRKRSRCTCTHAHGIHVVVIMIIITWNVCCIGNNNYYWRPENLSWGAGIWATNWRDQAVFAVPALDQLRHVRFGLNLWAHRVSNRIVVATLEEDYTPNPTDDYADDVTFLCGLHVLVRCSTACQRKKENATGPSFTYSRSKPAGATRDRSRPVLIIYSMNYI